MGLQSGVRGREYLSVHKASQQGLKTYEIGNSDELADGRSRDAIHVREELILGGVELAT